MRENDQEEDPVGTAAGSSARRSARHHLPLVFVTATYVAAVLAVGAATGLDVNRLIGWRRLFACLVTAGGATTIVAACMFTVFGLSWTVRRIDRARGRTRRFGSPWGVWRRHLGLERLCGAFLTLFLYALLMEAFVWFKSGIPEIYPFAWDETLMRLDRALHFGRHPWALLQPFVGKPLSTMSIDWLYYAWFPVNVIFLLAFVWLPPSQFRTRFFLAFFGLWIMLGTILALVFSSAGPCYFGRLVPGLDPYAPLLAYLRGVDAVHPLTAIGIQASLWNGYCGAEQLVEGIAAMPSLHVAVPVLFAIVGWRIDRRLGAVYAVYAALILIGSVHLAWHYAVDGYVTFVLVPAVWWLAGRFAPAEGASGCKRRS